MIKVGPDESIEINKGRNSHTHCWFRHYGVGIVHLNWFEKTLSNPAVETVVVT